MPSTHLTNSAAPEVDAAFVRSLAQSRAGMVDGSRVRQLGARTVPFIAAPSWPDLVGLPDEALIETFAVDEQGAIDPIIGDRALLDQWAPRAAAFAAAVYQVLLDHDVEPAGTGYLTCSISPTHLLEGDPHLDDSDPTSAHGVGLVAITASLRGPSVATAPVSMAGAAPNMPLAPSDDDVDAFAERSAPHHEGHHDAITVFGKFGQLHAGPSSSTLPAGATHRQLMVLRLDLASG